MNPLSVTVTRPLHPLAGQTLRVLGRMRRHGEEELLLVLQDGTKSLVPAAWTDLSEGLPGDGDALKATATLGTLEDLLAASRLARMGSPRLQGPAEQAARKPPSKEDNRAAWAWRLPSLRTLWASCR